MGTIRVNLAKALLALVTAICVSFGLGALAGKIKYERILLGSRMFVASDPSKRAEGHPDILVLPNMLVRPANERATIRQNFLRAFFEIDVSSSAHPISSINASFTEDGYLDALDATYTPSVLPSLEKEEAKVYVLGEGFIELCYPKRVRECIRSIVGKKYSMRRMYTIPEILTEAFPKVLIVVYGNVEQEV